MAGVLLLKRPFAALRKAAPVPSSLIVMGVADFGAGGSACFSHLATSSAGSSVIGSSGLRARIVLDASAEQAVERTFGRLLLVP